MTLYIGGLLVWSLIWGFATNAVIHNRGYDENWFWWGFFFGFIALIVACTKPQNQTDPAENSDSYAVKYGPGSLADDRENKKIMAAGGWVCRCGKTNRANVGTCACGRTKAEVLSKTKAENQEKSRGADKFEEIKKYKELLDAGVINQEEFDAKKQALLGLSPVNTELNMSGNQ